MTIKKLKKYLFINNFLVYRLSNKIHLLKCYSYNAIKIGYKLPNYL